MKKRSLKDAIRLARLAQERAMDGHIYDAWGLASSLEIMLERELDRKKKEKSNEGC